MAEHDQSSSMQPAAEWAMATAFGPVQVDCTTAVALKILDNKCKMLPGEKTAVMAVYDAVKALPGELLEPAVHEAIARARNESSESVMQTIHALRVEAEARIPKPVMKAYKAFLREGLFG